MPITAKLSRKFYEKFGDDITNELVDWLNHVDLTYRTELRQLNDLNYSRFEAKLEQVVHRREFEERFAGLRQEMHAGFALLRTEMAALRADLIKWMFLFWAGSTATMVGLAFTISRFVRP